jgi:DNA-binding CsgD family transcriptional regulator
MAPGANRRNRGVAQALSASPTANPVGTEERGLVRVLSTRPIGLSSRVSEGGAGAPACPLSRRELEALKWAASGMILKQIASRMGVKFTTVRSHVHQARRRLGVRTTTQAVVACIDAGWIDPVEEDPNLLRFTDRRVTAGQRVYLEAFDRHLKARDDKAVLEQAKRRTDAALVALDKPPRSVASRDWISSLLTDMARLSNREQNAA